MAKSSAAFNIIFGAKTGQLTKALNTTQRKLLKASAQMSATGKSLTRNLTLPLLAVGAGSLKLAVSFESSMLKVKAVSGATGKEFESLKNKALELGKSTTFTASEVAGLQLEYAKLGFTTEDINKVTESTLFLAQATGSDLAQAAAVAGATLGGFQLDATETARVTDVMAASFSSTPLDINTFQESMKSVAPVALSAGVSIEQTTAMLGVLAKAGISGSQAGTSLRRILSELGKTGGDVGEALRNLGDKGLGMGEAMDLVGKNAYASLLVLAEGTDTMDDLTKAFKNSEGSAKATADEMNSGAEGGIKEMMSALEGMAITIGDALMPTLNKLVDMIKSIADGFSRMSPTMQNFVLIIGLGTAALGPFLRLMGGIGTKVLMLVAMMRRKASVMAADAVSTGTAAAAQGAFSIATTGASAALVAFRTALISTGIGALVVALGLVIGYFIDWVTSTDDVTDSERDLNAELEEGNKLLKSRADILEDQTPLGNKSVKDLRKTISALNAEVDGIDEGAVLKAFLDPQTQLRGANGEDVINATLRDAITNLETLMSGDDMVKAIQGGDQFWIAEGADLLTQAVASSRKQLQAQIEAAEAQIKKIEDRTSGKKIETGEQADLQSIDSISKEYERLYKTIGYFKREAAAGELIDIKKLKELESEFSSVESLAKSLGIDVEYLRLKNDPFKPIIIDLKRIENLIPEADLSKGLKIDPKAADDIARMMELMAQRAERMQNIFDQAFSSMSGTMDEMAASGASAFDSLAKSIGQAVRKIISAQIAQAVSAAIMNAIKNSGGNPFVGGILAASGAVAAKGIFDRLIPAFATGGIVTKPTLSLIGEAGSEAIVPFNRMDEFIRMAGGGGDSGTMSVAGRLAGGDIYLSNQYANNNSGRRRAIV